MILEPFPLIQLLHFYHQMYAKSAQMMHILVDIVSLKLLTFWISHLCRWFCLVINKNSLLYFFIIVSRIIHPISTAMSWEHTTNSPSPSAFLFSKTTCFHRFHRGSTILVYTFAVVAGGFALNQEHYLAVRTAEEQEQKTLLPL